MLITIDCTMPQATIITRTINLMNKKLAKDKDRSDGHMLSMICSMWNDREYDEVIKRKGIV